MFGIVLAGISSALNELSDSIGKKGIYDRAESIYTFGFLNLSFGTVLFILVGFLRHDLLFSPASFPTFLPRILLEIVQAQLTVMVVAQADRGHFSLVRTLTIPLLLAADLSLGYAISNGRMIGMGLIVAAIFILLSSERYRTKGLLLLLLTAANAAITISLYKYDVSHFNSVEAEQSIVGLIVMAYFFTLARLRGGENPLRILQKPRFAAQALASGSSSFVGSFAILFAPASVITTALRASAVLFSILSGRFYFKEKRFFVKLLLFALMGVGLVLLVRT